MKFRFVILMLVINSEATVKFFIYSGCQNQIPVEIDISQLDQIDIDPTKTIRLLSHGWMNNHNSFWLTQTKDNLMSIGETNVVSIDWKHDAKHIFYRISAMKTKDDGEDVAKWIIALSETLDIPFSMFHLIGHSLGAHLVGFAAKSIFRKTKKKIGRITGLDPAGPYFNDKTPSERLDFTDAIFVDVIHTSNIFGYKTKLGHIDFWPNGGKKQFGCALHNCNHNRAPLYYAESVISRNFTAWKCESKYFFERDICRWNEQTVMGEFVDKNARGNFYLSTNKEAPFGCDCLINGIRWTNISDYIRDFLNLINGNIIILLNKYLLSYNVVLFRINSVFSPTQEAYCNGPSIYS